MSDDDKFERFLRDALQETYEPPPMREGAIWTRIAVAIQALRVRAAALRRVSVLALRVAAVVVVTAGLGLVITRRRAAPAAPSGPATGVRVPLSPADAQPFVRVAAAHFAEVRALLEHFGQSATAAPTAAADAREALRLLVRTRLLSQSSLPDTSVRELLAELEPVLVTAEDVASRRTSSPLDSELLLQSITDRRLLARLERASRVRSLHVAS